MIRLFHIILLMKLTNIYTSLLNNIKNLTKLNENWYIFNLSEEIIRKTSINISIISYNFNDEIAEYLHYFIK